MTDIVERLRDPSKGSPHWLLDTLSEAAAEIERLRHDLTLARLDRDHARAERDAARREGIEAAAEIAKQFAIHQGDVYDIVAAIRTKLLTEGER